MAKVTNKVMEIFFLQQLLTFLSLTDILSRIILVKWRKMLVIMPPVAWRHLNLSLDDDYWSLLAPRP